jgi:hypothetical protein
MSEERERILDALRRGVPVSELREALINLPDAEADDEPIECNIKAPRFIEEARERATRRVDTSGLCFPNPRDWQTMIDLFTPQEIAMAFCNVKDEQGGQLGNTVDDVAKRCVKAESGSRKQAKLIEDLRAEIHDLRLEAVRGKAGSA